MIPLLRITLAGDHLPCRPGPWPSAGPGRRLLLDPALPFAAAVSAVTLALKDHPTAWIVVFGRAAAPFLAAVGRDLAISVAGAVILAPRPWSAGRPLEHAPLPFPAVLIADPPDAPLALAWGATLLQPAPDQGVFDHPVVAKMLHRRSQALARTAGPRLVARRPYAAVAGTTVPPG